MTADQYLQTHTSASKAVSHCGARKGVPLRRPGSPAPAPPALPSAGLGGLHAGIWVRTCLTHKPCKPQAALQTYMYARRRDVTHGQGRAAVAREAERQRGPGATRQVGGRWEAGGLRSLPGASAAPLGRRPAHIFKELPEPSRVQGLELSAMLSAENI